MEVSVKSYGFNKFVRQLGEYEKTVRAAVVRELELSGQDLTRIARKAIANKTGSRTETRYKPRREQLVSKPGQYPNLDQASLNKSIQHEVNYKKLRLRWGSNLPYAKWLEFSTKYMKARPWLLPTVKKYKKEMIKNMIAAIRKAYHGK